MFRAPTEEEESNITALTSKYDGFFRGTRDQHIGQTIENVKKEHIKSHSHDHVDHLVEEQRNADKYKICLLCGGENDKRFRKCRNCGGLLGEHPSPHLSTDEECSQSPYNAFADIPIIENECTIVPGDLDPVNPNSFRTVADVL